MCLTNGLVPWRVSAGSLCISGDDGHIGFCFEEKFIEKIQFKSSWEVGVLL